MRVLVTGGAGHLGTRVVPRLAARGHDVRLLTHSGRRVVGAHPAGGDLATGEGLEAALEGAECVLHLASSPGRDSERVDVEGTRRLVEAAGRAGVRHLCYVSITGVNRLPHYRYYRHKLEAEHLVQAGAVPWSIVRATQFHGFLDGLLRQAAGRAVMVIPRGFRLQPIEVGEVASRLVEAVDRGPLPAVVELGGPQVLTSEALAAAWRAAQGVRKPLLALPLPGRTAAGFRAGAMTCPEQAVGRVTWSQWLAGARG